MLLITFDHTLQIYSSNMNSLLHISFVIVLLVQLFNIKLLL